ncbi:Sugar transport protein [Melia azedarach]|uniref:Sugar transport protein n=1 Tax=Melia azedarach TaxID=155640 RepID=A0ACC1Y0V8_MELAZ|nr:Sugar transport protein [Melia azedarach]
MGAKQVIVIYDEGNSHNSEGKLTAPVVIISIVVASVGLMFGYETGSYGVKTMQPFLKKFFPRILRKLSNSNADQYCVFDSSKLQAYSSSFYIAGIFSALLAGRLTTSAGRKGALIIGGMVYLIGVSLQTVAVNLEMLVFGRILIGFGIGFASQAAPMYLVEMAPTKWRGAIATGFPLFFEIGVFTAKWINNYLIHVYPNSSNGWRIALGLSALPATVMTVLSFFIPDTPSSLIQRGKVQEALKSLNQVRSVDVDTENELKYLVTYYEAMRNASEKPYQMLLEKKYRPQLVLAMAIPAFRQLVGMHLIGNFGPLVLRSLGAGWKQVFLTSFIHGTVVILSVLVATYLIDRIGRKMLLLEAGVQIFVSLVIMGILMAVQTSQNGVTSFSVQSAVVALVIRSSINAAFSWSWGTIVWILPSEVLSLEVRAAGQGLSLAFNFAFQFLVIQTMFPMLCNFKSGVFFFYAGWSVIMTLFVIFFVPETKRIPLESMDIIWRNHWYWKRYVHGPNTLLNPEIDRQFSSSHKSVN